jgi:TRAP-type transport system periplasmic protein
MTMKGVKKTGLLVVSVLFLGFTLFGLHSTAVQAAQIELSLAHSAPPTFVYQIIAEKFKEMLENKTGGKVTVKIFPAGQLGGEKDSLEAEIIGTLDMAITQSSLLALWEKQMVYIDVPYLYRDIDHALKVMNGPMGQAINQKMERHGIKVLACYDLGFRCVYNRKKPIFTPTDLAGMKYRVIQNPLYVDLKNAWGAKAVPMNFGEVYTAMQQGVIDAAGLEPYSYHIVKHYEVAPYFSITNHKYQSFVLSMSKKKFDSLPADVQSAIVGTATELIPTAAQITKDMDYRIIGKLVRENKVQFNTADIEAFQRASKSISDTYAAEVGQDIIDQIKAVK